MQESPPWLEEGDIPADPLGDFRTLENSISVWVVNDEKKILERIIAALAGGRGKLEHFDYLVFDAKILCDIGIEQIESDGKSVDTELSKSNHRDLVEISADKLVRLVKAICKEDLVECAERRQPKDVALIIAEAIDKGWIKKENLKDKLIREVLKTDVVKGQFPGMQA